MTNAKISTHAAAFMAAVEQGDLSRVQNFLHSGTPVDTCQDNGVTGLILASALGHLGLVDEFLDAGADINRADEHGYTALVEAARHGHPDVVRRLLHAGAELTIDVNRNEKNAVLYALDAGHEGIADLISKAGTPRSVPLLRGIESFDLDSRWIVVHAGVEQVAERFSRMRQLRWNRDMFGQTVRLSHANFAVLQFRAHEWTLITELHVETPVQRLKPDEAARLSEQLREKVLFFETSDLAGSFRYMFYRAGAAIEDFDTARAEDLGGRGPGMHPLSRILTSKLRKVVESELVNPEAFASRFAALQGIFIPAFAMGVGKTGDEGLMRIPGYVKTDFERLDYLG